MEIIRKIFGELENNCYIIFDQTSSEAYIIDPGYFPEKIADIIKRRRFKLKGILCTHYHYDHTDGCEKLRKMLDAKVFMTKRDSKRYKGHVDVFLRDKDVLMLGDERIEVIATPGHTSGSVSFICSDSKCIFTGDALFPTDTGYVIFETGSADDMESSVKRLDTLLTDDFMIWPGHEENVDMHFVRKHNKDYIGYLEGIHPEHTTMSPDDLK